MAGTMLFRQVPYLFEFHWQHRKQQDRVLWDFTYDNTWHLLTPNKFQLCSIASNNTFLAIIHYQIIMFQIFCCHKAWDDVQPGSLAVMEF